MGGCRCDIIFLNVHIPTEDKYDVTKDGFCEEVRVCIWSVSLVSHKNLLLDFNAKVEREDIFKQAFRNESLNKINNSNGVRIVNMTTTKNLAVKSTIL
jgi:hypothetical protein